MEIKKGSAIPFGATSYDHGVNFALYAKNADKMTLCIFDENNLSTPLHEIKLDKEKHLTGDVWHAHVKDLPKVFAYGYKVTRGEETHLILDPYAKCIAGDAKWHSPSRPEFQYQPLGKFTSSTFDWGDDKPLKLPMKDLVIYEMHVRGFTKHSSSKIKHPGTYLGVIEKIPYLLDLGVNAVELLPIHEFNEEDVTHINPETNQKLHNYFGYSTVNFFSPMTRYASGGKKDQVLNEFKTMVKELHKNGIEVILDVVFNHTAEGNEKGPVLSFKGLDPKAYYMINDNGEYLNFSGCGNTFNANHPITRQLILDSLRYWVLEMHVDGFRFDLASILNRAADGTPLPNAPIVEAISHDPILASTKLIAEAWDPGGLYQVGGFAPATHRWSEWNGKYRDVVRAYIKGSPGQKNSFAGVVSGSQHIYGGRAPTSTVNFITAHDGFSLADLVSYNEKHNNLNGEENRDGMNENESWNCGFEGETENKKVLNLRKKQIRNYHHALMISQGVPMILMGDEYAHTRKGNNNTWGQDNELNWFLWNELNEKKAFYRFYKSLIHFRKKHPLLKRDTFFNENDVKWHGLVPDQPNWDQDNHFTAFSLHFPEGHIELFVAFNASHIYQDVTLPPPGEGKAWRWVVNTANLPPDDFFEENNVKRLPDDEVHMAPYSSILLQVVNHTPTY